MTTTPVGLQRAIRLVGERDTVVGRLAVAALEASMRGTPPSVDVRNLNAHLVAFEGEKNVCTRAMHRALFDLIAIEVAAHYEPTDSAAPSGRVEMLVVASLAATRWMIDTLKRALARAVPGVLSSIVKESRGEIWIRSGDEMLKILFVRSVGYAAKLLRGVSANAIYCVNELPADLAFETVMPLLEVRNTRLIWLHDASTLDANVINQRLGYLLQRVAVRVDK